MIDETQSSRLSNIVKSNSFPVSTYQTIYCGPNIGIANPLYKCAQRNLQNKSNYDSIDLSSIDSSYLPRVKFSYNANNTLFYNKYNVSKFNDLYVNYYRIFIRKRINLRNERTLVPAIVPKGFGHINSIIGVIAKENLPLIAGSMASIVFDFCCKITGRTDISPFFILSLPLLSESAFSRRLTLRSLRLNCLTSDYAELWRDEWRDDFAIDGWAKSDPRLKSSRFTTLTGEWG
jgi:hypothetical protein